MPRSSNTPVINKPVINKPVVNNSVLQNRLGNEPSNFFSNIKQGFGFGIGSSIAHNIFDSEATKPLPPRLHPVIDKTTEFKQCMEKTYNNYEECAPILK